MKKKVLLVAGARPNFMKIASMIHALDSSSKLEYILVHTGQHYDKLLSDNFFEDLEIPTPNYNLKVGSGSHAFQTAEIMKAFEPVLEQEAPDMVIVVGDVNSTMACTITAKKMGVRVAHVEAGIRSFDNEMPEEINRILTDSICDYFFTTSEVANENLKVQGVKDDQIHLVGNTMIDTLEYNLPKLEEPQSLKPTIDSPYALVTLHRPSNVDSPEALNDLLARIGKSLEGYSAVFPVHPRTLSNIDKSILPKNIVLSPPLRYLEFIYLLKNSMVVVTDSGGIQEETSHLNVPCLTLRENTERPETITWGSNTLIGKDYDLLDSKIQEVIKGAYKKGNPIPHWDGKTGQRITTVLERIV